MKKVVSMLLSLVMLLSFSGVQVQAASKEPYISVNSEYGFEMEIPNYIGETENLVGFNLIDTDGFDLMEINYSVSANYLSTRSLGIFLLDSEELTLPISYNIYKKVLGYDVSDVSVYFYRAALNFNDNKNVDFEHIVTVDVITQDKGEYFQFDVEYYNGWEDNPGFLFMFDNYFYDDNGEMLCSYMHRTYGIVLTPSLADEVVNTGKLDGQVIPGLREKIVEYRSGLEPKTQPQTSNNDIKVMYNDAELNFDLPILNKNGRTFYPFRELVESLGGEVEWDGATNTAIATLNNNKVEFPIGSNDYMVNGASMKMDDGIASFIEDGRTYIPVRFACEGLGFSVEWDANTNTIIIKMP